MNKFLTTAVILTMVLYCSFTLYVMLNTPVTTVYKAPQTAVTTQPLLPTPTPIPVLPANLVSPTIQKPVQPTAAPQRDFFAETAKHNSSGDCWMIISGHVYDITNYFGMHPGGDRELAKFCGKDATDAFNTKDGRGQPHSAGAQGLLIQYLIR